MSDDTTTRKRIPYYGYCPQCGKEMTTAHRCTTADHISVPRAEYEALVGDRERLEKAESLLLDGADISPDLDFPPLVFVFIQKQDDTCEYEYVYRNKNGDEVSPLRAAIDQARGKQ